MFKRKTVWYQSNNYHFVEVLFKAFPNCPIIVDGDEKKFMTPVKASKFEIIIFKPIAYLVNILLNVSYPEQVWK